CPPQAELAQQAAHAVARRVPRRDWGVVLMGWARIADGFDDHPTVLQVRHPHESVPKIAYRMAAMREQVKRLLLEELPESQSHGGDRRSNEVHVRATNLNAQTDTAEYVVARLKRDDPALAEKVIRGELDRK